MQQNYLQVVLEEELKFTNHCRYSNRYFASVAIQ